MDTTLKHHYQDWVFHEHKSGLLKLKVQYVQNIQYIPVININVSLNDICFSALTLQSESF